MAQEVIPGRGRKEMLRCLYSVFYQLVHNKANATQCQYKTELSSQTKTITIAITFVETCHNTNLLLASESQRIIQLQQESLAGTEMWPFLLKHGKKWLIPSPERMVSGKWHHILPLLFMSPSRASFSYI